MAEKKKLYAYIDESGQDTGGTLFVVTIVVLEENREALRQSLEMIEEKTGKRNVKWRKARQQYRMHYIDALPHLDRLENTVFFEMFTNTKHYLEMTSYAAARAIAKKSRNERPVVSVFIDGFKKQEIVLFSKALRDLNIKRRKVVGVKRDENNALIRLADAICGLVRDAAEGNEWAGKALNRLIKKGVAHAL